MTHSALPLVAAAYTPTASTASGVGPESKLLERHLIEAQRHSRRPLSRRSLSDEFASLAATWSEDTAHFSTLPDIVLHPAYQRIIGLGMRAVPLILNDLATRGGHWFWALRAITGADPVPPDDRGNVRAMKRAWLAWGAARGLLE